MRKDIFIDNNVAKNFSNPLDKNYQKLVIWLITFDSNNLAANAYLAVSNKLLAEYSRTSAQSNSDTNIVAIIHKMTREGRIFKVTSDQIKEFHRTHFTKRVAKRLTCNAADRYHIPIVLLSDRKYALSLDRSLVRDLLFFPGFSVTAERRPQDLNYDS